MRRILLVQGQRFRIYALVLANGDCPVENFIAHMPDASRKSMLNVLQRHAEAGQILNEQKARLLGDGIFEFKSRQGDRLLWFYPPGRSGQTIITQSFHKGAPLRSEIQRAKQLRDQYHEEVGQ